MPHGVAEQGTEEEENEVHLGTARRRLRSVKCLRLETHSACTSTGYTQQCAFNDITVGLMTYLAA